MKRFCLLFLGLCLLISTAALADYDFSYSGGTGKVVITCPQIEERADGLWAMLVFSSSRYTQVRIGESIYETERTDSESSVWIPAQMDQQMTILATTIAMSTPHEVAYTILLSSDGGTKQGTLPGFNRTGSLDLSYAETFTADFYEDGYCLITVRDSGRYLVIPEDAEVPSVLPRDVVPIQQPIHDAYLCATSAMSLIAACDALQQIRFSGTQTDGWFVEAARDAMYNGQIAFAGKYSEPDYEQLLLGHCDMAIESMMILHTPKVKEMLETLGIPVFIDTSSSEPSPMGRMEWIKLYGILFGKEEEAVRAFEVQEQKLADLAERLDTGKTCAFFYLHSNGTVVLRGGQDYLVRMINQAGLEYLVPKGLESQSGSIPISLEDFYAAAGDADILIYNASIESPLASVQDLLARQPIFGTFKAVRNHRVYTTQRSLYQATDQIADVILEFACLGRDGADDSLQFFTAVH